MATPNFPYSTEWIDKINGIDKVNAEDVNQLYAEYEAIREKLVTIPSIISDTTLSNPWVNGINNVGAVFTSTAIAVLSGAHPIEIEESKAGLLNYNSDNYGGTYYNKSSTTGNFSGFLYVGGTDIIITAVGHGLPLNVPLNISFSGALGTRLVSAISVDQLKQVAANPGTTYSGTWSTNEFCLYSTVARREGAIISLISGNGITATVTTSGHGLPLSTTIPNVTISGTTNFNGTYTVTTTGSTTVFTFTQTNAPSGYSGPNSGTFSFTTIVTPSSNTTFNLRSAGALSLTVAIEPNCIIYSDYSYAKTVTSANTTQYLLNASDNGLRVFGNTGMFAYLSKIFFDASAGQAKKYGKNIAITKINRLSTSFTTLLTKYSIIQNYSGQQSDDKANSITYLTPMTNGAALLVENVTAELSTITINSSGTSLIRNGSRIIVVRDN